ncbi:hypothetical protein JCM8097_009210 [Rhodosporidiobolus ruineniae]
MRSVSLLLALAATAVAAPTSSPSTTSSSPASSSSSASSSSTQSATSASPSLTADGFTSQKWIDAFDKAKEVVSQMTLNEKINWTSSNPDTAGCSGRTYPIERLGIPAMCFADGPTGINSRYSTQFPAEVTTGATFDKALFAKRAEAMGKEYQAVGVHIPLSIVGGGPMGRSVYGGRNWENWSPDQVLTSEATKAMVKGFNAAGVVAQVKHFLGNEQEYLRVGRPLGGYASGPENQTIDSLIDSATLRELYAYPFAEAVREGAGSVMCSYNEINGTLGCENDATLNKLLKEELDAHAAVMSDWGAAHHTVPAALNGTDFPAGNSVSIWGDKLAAFIQNGTVPDTVVDDKLIRFLTAYYALDQDSLPETDINAFVAWENSTAVVREIAEGSLTLLKNVRSANETRGLPLQKGIRDLILVGSPAGPGPYGAVASLSGAFYYTTANDYPGFVTDGFGSGGSASPREVTPLAGITERAWKEERPVIVDAYLSDNATEGVARLPGSNTTFSYLDYKLGYANSTVVFVSATAMEGYDRKDLKLERNGDELISYVAERHSDVSVVITAPGPVDMSSFVDHPNITSIIYAYFPTTEGGNAIASVLFGDVSPSGKLPFTLAKNASDFPLNMYNGTSLVDPTTNFTEGPLIDYRYFDAKDITPLYEFGYGLSYSNFSFSDLEISETKKQATAPVRETNEKLLVDGTPSTGLYDVAYTVEATVANTGSVDAAEVAQLYITYPDSTPRKLAPRNLRGFEKPFLKVGESSTVSFELRNKDLAYYSVPDAAWRVPEGEFTVSVGSSSRQLPLKGTIQV